VWKVVDVGQAQLGGKESRNILIKEGKVVKM
jgi:hypothetical protein